MQTAQTPSVRIAARLSIDPDSLVDLYADTPGVAFALTPNGRALAERFRLRTDEPLGLQLADRGELSEDEGLLLDGVEL